MVTIRAQATSGIAPKWVMLAPVEGVRKVLERAGWTIDEVDLFELNEAFAVQAIGVTRELGIALDKVNVNGGAVAIGHPIGASGARVLVTLIHEMMRSDAKKGVAALCLGGGNSVALAVERRVAVERRRLLRARTNPRTHSLAWCRAAPHRAKLRESSLLPLLGRSAGADCVLNFSTSSGKPSSRRRRWPIGYSTVSSSTVPSFNSMRSELAIERFSGS